MGDFPKLKTGAVAQYPLAESASFATEVVTFLDGSEQRFRRFGGRLRRWVVRLELLNEAETESLEQFFRTQQAKAGRFVFTDPRTNVDVANCSFEDDAFTVELEGEARARTTLIVRENLT